MWVQLRAWTRGLSVDGVARETMCANDQKIVQIVHFTLKTTCPKLFDREIQIYATAEHHASFFIFLDGVLAQNLSVPISIHFSSFCFKFC